MMVGEHIRKEQLELIAGRTIKDADEDIDESINFEEFKKVFIILKLTVFQIIIVPFTTLGLVILLRAENYNLVE